MPDMTALRPGRHAALAATGALLLAAVGCGGGSPSHTHAVKPGPTEVVKRISSNASVSTSGTSAVPYPLTNNTWTQAANETDLYTGRFTFDVPPGCQDDLDVVLLVNGKPTGFLGANYPEDFSPGSSNNVVETGMAAYTYEPAASAARTLTARIKDDCPTGDYTVKSLQVTVLGIK